MRRRILTTAYDRHYFSRVKIKDKNVVMSSQLCTGVKNLSTSKSSNSYLMKHLKQHALTKLVAKDPSPTDAEGATPCNLEDGYPNQTRRDPTGWAGFGVGQILEMMLGFGSGSVTSAR